MEKRYQVFVSSTFRDLKAERKGVRDVLTSMKCFVTGMEDFPAYDMEQFEYIKKEIDECDYYLLILADNYGSEADDGISFTEKEYLYAQEKGIPILAFVKNEGEAIVIDKTTEGIEKRYKLNKFREKVMENRLASKWDDRKDLEKRVQDSMYKAFKADLRTGWVKYSPELERIKNRRPVNTFIHDAKKEVFISGNGLNSIYDSVTEMNTLLDQGVKIRLVLLSETNLEMNCAQLGAGFKKMRRLIETALIRLNTYYPKYLGTQLLVKQVSAPIWTNIIARDMDEENGLIGANHLLYDTSPADCLYTEFCPTDKFYSIYKTYMEYLWDSGEMVDFSSIEKEND